MSETSLRELARAKLAESGLTPEDGRRLRMEALDASKVQKLHASLLPRPALRIPYFTLAGKPSGFFRLRYLGEANGFDKLRKKQPRYVQLPDTSPEIYLPPLVDWEEMSGNAGAALFITEGEFKAACATKHGYPTIGLGGVWSWRSKKKAMGFLPALEAFAWKGRLVYLIFDSDYAENPDVMRALVALAKELSARGAHPSLVTLPSLPELEEHGKKTGLDDFLVRKGSDALQPLLTEALPFNQCEELWKLNGEVVYIRNPGLIVELETGRKMSAAAFKEHCYANRHYWESQLTAKGEERMVKKPLAPAWLAWEQRAELERITYKPGQPRITEAGEYNYWPGWGAEPKKGDVSLWKKLLAYMFAGDAEAMSWFEKWAAFPIQNPGTKMYAAVVVWGATHGTGKSLIGYSLGACYGKNFKEIDDDALAGGGFNEWAENRQFVMGDDVTGSEYRKATMENLKRMITRQTLTVNAKYMPTYEVPDVINYYFTANSPDAFVLEDTDRRYFVIESPAKPLPDAFYVEYDEWLKSGRLAQALLWYLMHEVDCSGFNPHAHAPMTPAKRAMIADGKSDLGAWVAMVRDYPEDVLRMGEVPCKSELWSNTQLLFLYDPEGKKKVTANGLGRELKRAGIPQVNKGATVRTAKGPMRLYAVRNAERWVRAKPQELAQHWNEHFANVQPKKEKF